jgi:hypothetical protein
MLNKKITMKKFELNVWWYSMSVLFPAIAAKKHECLLKLYKHLELLYLEHQSSNEVDELRGNASRFNLDAEQKRIDEIMNFLRLYKCLRNKKYRISAKWQFLCLFLQEIRQPNIEYSVIAVT